MSNVLFFHPVKKTCHHHGSFTVDFDAQKCECKECGKEVSPWFVIQRMVDQESRWNEGRLRAKAIADELDKRLRTKCRHCGKMTKIRI